MPEHRKPLDQRCRKTGDVIIDVENGGWIEKNGPKDGKDVHPTKDPSSIQEVFGGRLGTEGGGEDNENDEDNSYLALEQSSS